MDGNWRWFGRIDWFIDRIRPKIEVGKIGWNTSLINGKLKVENGKLFKIFSFNKNVGWEKPKRFPPFSETQA